MFFGICASCFRIFRRPIIGDVETVTSVTKAVVALHNFLMTGKKFGESHDGFPSQRFGDKDTLEQIETEGLLPLKKAGSNNYTRSAKEVRDNFREYFNSPAGSVPWQWETVSSTQDPFDD